MLFFKDILDDGCLREVEFLLFYVVKDHVNLGDDLFAPSDRVEKGFVEVVWGSIHELNKIILCDSVHHIICILLGDVHMIVLHLSRAEYRHLL